MPKFRIATICTGVATSWLVKWALFTVELRPPILVQLCEAGKTFHFYTRLPRACPLSLLRLCTPGAKLLLYILVQFHQVGYLCYALLYEIVNITIASPVLTTGNQ